VNSGTIKKLPPNSGSFLAAVSGSVPISRNSSDETFMFKGRTADITVSSAVI
jgi:hypothetical protein